MAVYLKEFENHIQYENYINGSGAILPNVSICTTEGDVHYNPSSPVPPTPSYDYVEIGGLKWATMNVGANSITDTGLYFQWGDISGYTADQVGSGGDGKKWFSWPDYKYSDGTIDPVDNDITKYNKTDRKTVLETYDDAVIANWGGSWRMPTVSEYQTLINAVNTAWTQVNNVYGILCTDKTDNSKVLFFPAAGDASHGNITNVNTYGYYWTKSLYSTYDPRRACLLVLNSSDMHDSYIERRHGFPIRGILDE